MKWLLSCLKKYNLETLPEPNNKNLNIYTEKSNISACIQYSGYSNEKIEKRKDCRT